MFILYSINKSYKSQHLFITFYKFTLSVSHPSISSKSPDKTSAVASITMLMIVISSSSQLIWFLFFSAPPFSAWSSELSHIHIPSMPVCWISALYPLEISTWCLLWRLPGFPSYLPPCASKTAVSAF